MTDQTTTTWHVAEDPNSGEDTLWRGDRSVIRHGDLYRVTTMQSDADDLFDVWVRVLAPDEATIDRLATLLRSQHPQTPWSAASYRSDARIILAALAGSGESG